MQPAVQMMAFDPLDRMGAVARTLRAQGMVWATITDAVATLQEEWIAFMKERRQSHAIAAERLAEASTVRELLRSQTEFADQTVVAHARHAERMTRTLQHFAIAAMCSAMAKREYDIVG
ncbi:MAG: hypothetical protein VYB54_10580 [Pseudomonadota bacterium]|nr:hypothetical protein [Pseudomonadota bacterium]